MGTVYEAPYLDINVGGWANTDYLNLTVEQKERYNTIKNGGIKLLIFHSTSRGSYGDIYYARANQTLKVYFALYGTNNIAKGYFRRSDEVTTLYTLQIENVSSFPSNSANLQVSSEIYHRSLEHDENTIYYPQDGIVMYSTYEEALAAISLNVYPITYRPTNCVFVNAPTEAIVGQTVTVPVEFTEGYHLGNPSDIYVTCNGVAVEHTYLNGVLTFTMPDPT